MALTPRERKRFQIQHKLFMAAMQIERSETGRTPTQAEIEDIERVIGEIAGRLLGEYESRRDRTLWLDRLIKSGEVWDR